MKTPDCGKHNCTALLDEDACPARSALAGCLGDTLHRVADVLAFLAAVDALEGAAELTGDPIEGRYWILRDAAKQLRWVADSRVLSPGTQNARAGETARQS